MAKKTKDESGTYIVGFKGKVKGLTGLHTLRFSCFATSAEEAERKARAYEKDNFVSLIVVTKK